MKNSKKFYLYTLLLACMATLIMSCPQPTGRDGGEVEKYTLTIGIEGQGTTSPPSGGQYDANTVVSLIPTPDTDWFFDCWAGTNKDDVVYQNNEWQIVMNENKTITACFEQQRGSVDGYIYGIDGSARGMQVLSKGLLEELEGATIEPISGATVSIASQTTSTNLNGYFIINDILTGIYNLTVTCPNYSDLNVPNVVIAWNQATHVDTQTMAASKKAWNFLVYLDADNNLESFAISDMNEMEQVGSNADVNILVLIDRIPGYDTTNGDWTGTRLYYVKQDVNTSTINSYLVVDLGEKDMSDPATLRDFIIYCQTYFPADNTVLTLWNHGAGTYPRAVTLEEKSKTPFEKKYQRTTPASDILTRGICWDDTTGGSAFDCLTIDEVASALNEARAVTGEKIDIINMDACLMQMLEVAYEWRDEIDYLVGSEEEVPGDGNDYATVLNHLTGSPSQSVENFAITLVDDYYSQYSSQDYTTYSALKLGTAFNLFMTAFNTWATALKNTDYQSDTVYESWYYSMYFSSWEYIDLGYFCALLAYYAPYYENDTAVINASNNLITAIATIVIHNRTTFPYASAYGLSIFFPYWDWFSDGTASNYKQLQLAVDTNWDDFCDVWSSWFGIYP